MRYGIVYISRGIEVFVSSLTDLGRNNSPRFLIGYVKEKRHALSYPTRDMARDACDTIRAYGGSDIDFVAPVTLD